MGRKASRHYDPQIRGRALAFGHFRLIKIVVITLQLIKFRI